MSEPESEGETQAESESEAEAETEAGDGGNAPKEHLNADDIEKLLNEASQSLEQATGDAAPAATGTEADPQPYRLGELTPDPESDQRQPIDILGEVELDLRVELGRAQMRLEEVLQLRQGSVVALDKLAGDPVDIFVNGRLIARGEVLVMNDNFCVRVTELVGA